MFLQNKLNIFNGRMAKFYYILFNMIAITIIIYIAVDTFYRVVRIKYTQVNTQSTVSQDMGDEKSSVPPSLSSYKTIADRNIFSRVAVTPQDNAINIDDLDSTSLKLVLIGTFKGNNETSAAIIEDTSTRPNTTGLYRIGDTIQNAEIISIERRKVALRVGNKNEVLSMDDDKPTTSTTKTAAQTTSETTETSSAVIVRNVPIKRSLINESLGDLNELLSQASIKAHSTDGEPDGLSITGIKAGSIYRRMGLRNGDIITGVNDEPIKTTEDIIGMYNDLKSSSEVSLQITRRGRARSFNYSISD